MHDLTLPDDDRAAARPPHPLVARLGAEFGWPWLETEAALQAFTGGPGAHCVFIPGDAARNLETPDAAVVLPELQIAFQRAFDCAVAGAAIETPLKEATRALKAPAFLFFREGRFLGAIEKIRDWDDYIARISHLLSAKG